MRILRWASATALGALVLATGLSACSGHAGDGCHSTSDCASGLSCSGPNDGPSCGIPPRMDCSTSADCSAGEPCHSVLDPCSASGLGSECGPPCTSASCGDGLRCNAQGACEPIPCDEGFACAVYQHCDPAAAHATGPVGTRTQGCVSVTCKADGDCPTSTFCVNGACQSGPGHCAQVYAVP